MQNKDYVLGKLNWAYERLEHLKRGIDKGTLNQEEGMEMLERIMVVIDEARFQVNNEDSVYHPNR